MFLVFSLPLMSRPSPSGSTVQTQVPRTEQAPLNSDDLSELLSIVSSTSSEESSHDYKPGEVRSIQGSSRLFSAQNEIYLLPLGKPNSLGHCVYLRVEMLIPRSR
jgi:hypothetical protein